MQTRIRELPSSSKLHNKSGTPIISNVILWRCLCELAQFLFLETVRFSQWKGMGTRLWTRDMRNFFKRLVENEPEQIWPFLKPKTDWAWKNKCGHSLPYVEWLEDNDRETWCLCKTTEKRCTILRRAHKGRVLDVAQKLFFSKLYLANFQISGAGGKQPCSTRYKGKKIVLGNKKTSMFDCFMLKSEQVM